MVDNLKETIAKAENETSLKYSDHANHVKTCIRLLMQLLAGFFKWSGFNKNTHDTILIASLTPLAGGDKSSDISTLATAAIDFFMTLEPIIIDMKRLSTRFI